MTKPIHAVPTPGIFTREYTNKDGVKHIWYFNHGKMDRGPFKVEMEYPAGWKSDEETNDSLPITKQMFFNPANNKMVGYGRAVQLGLYKPEPGDGKRGRKKKI